jgi:hypothetical protein
LNLTKQGIKRLKGAERPQPFYLRCSDGSRGLLVRDGKLGAYVKRDSGRVLVCNSYDEIAEQLPLEEFVKLCAAVDAQRAKMAV